ncbi:Whirlin [Portunus trituberculatus]|uniref:Whirlin n=1 Tax=Portunus trituberculatus TaxID=210409 RepID=A0A5B7HNV0_PORTR|nr:Whirlin [Portunus trituberculatus]
MRDGGPTAAAPLEAAHGPPFRPKTPLGSTSSCSSSVAGGGRVRAVRMVRRKGETYGFSLRGGKEHGTGFFISHVEPGSEAFLQGLRGLRMCLKEEEEEELGKGGGGGGGRMRYIS